MTVEATTIKVHGIIEGPFHSFDVEYDEEGEYEGDFYFCLALVEADGQTTEEEIRFSMFPDFYEMKVHLDKYTEPYLLEAEAF